MNRNTGLKDRILSMLLAVIMLLSTMPTTAISAYALEDNEPAVTEPVQEGENSEGSIASVPGSESGNDNDAPAGSQTIDGENGTAGDTKKDEIKTDVPAADGEGTDGDNASSESKSGEGLEIEIAEVKGTKDKSPAPKKVATSNDGAGLYIDGYIATPASGTYGSVITARIVPNSSDEEVCEGLVAYYAAGASGKQLLSFSGGDSGTVELGLASGEYVLRYEYGYYDSESGQVVTVTVQDGNFSITVSPATLKMTDITFDGKTAKWDAVSQAGDITNINDGNHQSANVTYEYIVYKDGVAVTEAIATSGREADIASVINSNGAGRYSISVRAVSGNESYYASSAFSDKEYSDGTAPAVSEYQAVSGNPDSFTAKAQDTDSGLKYYAFSTADSAEAAAADRKAVENAGSSADFAAKTFTGVPDAEGTWYFYAWDSYDNVSKSSTGIKSTEIKFYDYYEDGQTPGIGDKISSKYLLGEDPSRAISDFYPTSSMSKTGYDFRGWCYYDDTGILQPCSTVSSNVNTVYAMWKVADPTLVITVDGSEPGHQDPEDASTPYVYSRDYSGNASVITASGDFKGADVTWTWAKSGGSVTPVDDHPESISVLKVSDSGTYTVTGRATIDGYPVVKTATIIVTIDKKDLSIKIKDVELKYNSNAPTQEQYNSYYELSGTVVGEDSFTLNLSSEYTRGAAPDSTFDITYTYTADNYTITQVYPEGYGGKITVSKRDASEEAVILFPDDQTQLPYNAQAQTPEVTVKLADGTVLTKGDDYTLSYSDADDGTDLENIGLKKVKVEFTGPYLGSKTATYEIIKAKPEGVTIDISDFTYNAQYADPGIANLPAKHPAATDPDDYVSYTFYSVNGAGTRTAMTEIPKNAGKYYVEASVAETDNYLSLDIQGVAFEIKKVEITITPASDSWVYDGNIHSNSAYSVSGDFVGSDSFKFIKVGADGTATVRDVGKYDNVVKEYELSDSTIAGNYNVTCATGTLEITKVKLPYPSNAQWSADDAGTASWIPVARDGVVIEYEVALYAREVGTTEAVAVNTVSGLDASEKDFSANIIAFCEAHSDKKYEFFFTVKAVPKSGDKAVNYSDSDVLSTDSETNLRTVYVYTEAGSGIASAKVNGKDGGWFFLGEKVTATATAAEGYSLDGSVDIWEVAPDGSATMDTKKPSSVVTLISVPDGDGKIKLKASATDEPPYVDSFSAVLENGAAYDDIVISVTAKDKISATHYYISTDDITVTDHALPAGTEIDWVAFDQPGKTATGTITLSGDNLDLAGNVYHAYVKDSSGQVTKADTTVKIYKVSFDANGGEGTMNAFIKPQDTSVAIPNNKFIRANNSFVNWKGDDGIFYSDGETFRANKNLTLYAQWSLKNVKYRVEYFYMKPDGTYNTVCDEVSGYTTVLAGTEIKYNASDIQRTRSGIETLDPCNFIDGDTTKPKTLIVGENISDNVIKLYYKRSEFSITYTYTKPDGSTETCTTETYRYGQTVPSSSTAGYTVPEPVLDGYTFTGWTYSVTESRPDTMPFGNVQATGRFIANDAKYHINIYYQDTAGTGYTLETSEADVSAKHGDKVSFADATAAHPEHEGVEYLGLVFSEGPMTAAVANPDIATDGEGTVFDGSSGIYQGKELYINYFYNRKTYDVTLYLYRTPDTGKESEQRTAEWLLYTETKSFRYGADVTEALNGFTNDPDGWQTRTGFNPDGLDMSGYSLAEYIDWSTKTMPDEMPAANIRVEREYVRNVTSPYKVQIYYQNADGTYTDPETHVLKNPSAEYIDYARRGAEVTVDHDTSKESSTTHILWDQYTYTDYFEFYEFDTAESFKTEHNPGADPVNQRIVSTIYNPADDPQPDEDDHTLVLKLFYKRKEVTAKIYYYERVVHTDGSVTTSSEPFATATTEPARWGTKYSIKPLDHFWETYSVTGESYFVSECTVVYDTVNNGGTGRFEFTESAQVDPNIDYTATLGYYSASDVPLKGNYNHTNVYYTYYEQDAPFIIKMQYTNGTSTTGLIGVRNGEWTMKTNEPLTYGGEQIYVANKSSIFVCTSSISDETKYPGLVHLYDEHLNNNTRVYTYGALDAANGFDGGVANLDHGTLYHNNGRGSLPSGWYAADSSNQLYYGNYVNYGFGKTGDEKSETKDAAGYWLIEEEFAAYKKAVEDGQVTDASVDKAYIVNPGFNVHVTSPYTDNIATYTYTFAYSSTNNTYPVYYHLDGRICSHGHTGSKGSPYTVATGYHAGEGEARYTARDGFELNWYYDSACTIPVKSKAAVQKEGSTTEFDYIDATETYKAGKVYTRSDFSSGRIDLYGQYDSISITNNAVIYYQLPDGSYMDNVDVSTLEEAGTDVTVYTFTDAFNVDRNFTNIVTYNYKYTDADSPYYNQSFKAVVTIDVSGQTFKDASFKYTDYISRTGTEVTETGYTFDSNSKKNVLEGYAEATPITLVSYVLRDKYQVTKDLDTENVDNKVVVDRNGAYIDILEKPVLAERRGYDFCGWLISDDASEVDPFIIKVGETALPAEYNGINVAPTGCWLENVKTDTDGNVTFSLPVKNITAKAIWAPAKVDVRIIHYFPDADNAYEQEFVAEMLSDSPPADGRMESDGSIYRITADFPDGLLVAKVETKKLTIDTEPTLSEFIISSTKYTFENAAIKLENGTSWTVTDSSETFKVKYGMEADYFYSVSDFVVNAAAAATDNGEAGADITGARGYYANARVTVKAVPDSGYTFYGWYNAEDILGADGKVKSNYKDITKVSESAQFSFNIDEDKNYIVLLVPDVPEPKTVTIAGRSEYPYGYKTNADSILTASVNLSEEELADTRIVSYRWYTVDGETETLIEGENSATIPFPEGKPVGEYIYRCKIVLEDRFSERQVECTSAPADYKVTVTLADMDVEFTPYDEEYDGEYHGITMNANADGMPPYYDVYYSDEPLDSTNYSTKGTKDASAYTYRDVELAGNAVVTHTVYYYIKDTSDEHGGKVNYNDKAGSSTVKISPKQLKIKAAGTPYTKVYDGNDEIKGEAEGQNKYRLMHGAETYFILDGMAEKDKQLTGQFIEFDAKFDAAHVETAKNVHMTNVVLKLVNPETGEPEANINYIFPTDESYTIPGYITPKEVHIVWTNTELVYNGKEQGPDAAIAPDTTIPDTGLTLIKTGEYTNAGTYTANAELDQNVSTYKSSDYALDTPNKQFTISKYEVILQYKHADFVYDGKSHEPSELDTDLFTLPADHKIEGYKPEMPAVAVDAGTYTNIKVKAGTPVISRKSGTDRYVDATENFEFSLLDSDITINKRPVTIDGIEAPVKRYDGTDAATLSFTNAVVKNVVAGEALSIIETNITGAYTGVDAGVYNTESKCVNLTYASYAGTDAFTGDSKTKPSNYELVSSIEGTDYKTQTWAPSEIIGAEVKITLSADPVVYGQKIVVGLSYKDVAKDETVPVSEVYGTISVKLNGKTLSNITVTGESSFEISAEDAGYPDASDTAYTIEAVELQLHRYSAGNNNYEFSAVSGSVEVGKRPVKAAAADNYAGVEKNYDGTTNLTSENRTSILNDGYKFIAVPGESESGVVVKNGTADTVKLADTFGGSYSNKNAGDDRPVTVTGCETTNTNYYVPAAHNSFVVAGKINPRPVTVTPDDKEKTYGENDPTFTVTYSQPTQDNPYSGIVSGETLDLIVTREKGATAHESEDVREAGYKITAVENPENKNGNYAVTFNEGKLTIKQRELKISVSPESTITYGDPTPEMTMTLSNWAKNNAIGIDDAADDSLVYAMRATLEKFCDADSGNKIVSGSILPVKTYNLKAVINEDAARSIVTNYYLTYKTTPLKVEQKLISIAGVKAKDKMYDATTAAELYATGDYLGDTDHPVTLMGLIYQDLDKATLKLKASEVTAKFADKNVADDITVNLTYTDNALVAINISSDFSLSNYKLDKTTQTTTSADITKREVKVGVQPTNADHKTVEVKYGTATPLPSTLFVPTYDKFYGGETAAVIDDITKLIISCPTYTSTTDVTDTGDKYLVIEVDVANVTAHNYSFVGVPGKLEVIPNRYTAPASTWDTTDIGTLNWPKVEDIGNTHVAAYNIQLFKGNTSVSDVITVDAGTLTSYSYSFASAIRAKGGGTYHVNITAVSSNETDVGSSDPKASPNIYATTVKLVYANGTEGQGEGSYNLAIKKMGSEEKVTGKGTTAASYVLIQGESTTIEAIMKNATGYKATAESDNSALTVAAAEIPSTYPEDADTKEGIYTNTISLGSGSKASTTVTVKLAKRPATLTAEILAYYKDPAKTDPDSPVNSLVFGYNNNYVEIKAVPGVTAEDNFRDTSNYTYAFKWYLQYNPLLEEKKYVDMSSAAVSADAVVWTKDSENAFPADLKVYRDRDDTYKIFCELTATRKDNGEKVTLTKEQLNRILPVEPAKIDPRLESSTWTFGETRYYKTVSGNLGGGTVTYYYAPLSSTAAAEWVWTSGAPEDETVWKAGRPVDAGEYYIAAYVAKSANYKEGWAQTDASGNRTVYTIRQARLKSIPENELTLTYPDTEGRATAYGTATWTEVTKFDPNYPSTGSNSNDQNLSENMGNTGSTETISVKYERELQFKEPGASEYTTVWTKTADTSLSDDYLSNLTAKGSYKFIVRPKSSNTENCLDAVPTEKIIDINWEIPAKEINKTYDGNPIVLSVEGCDNSGIVWMLDGAYAGTGAMWYVYDVAKSGCYTANIPGSGSTEFATPVTVTVTKRDITFKSDNASKIYDGTSLTYKGFSVAGGSVDVKAISYETTDPDGVITTDLPDSRLKTGTANTDLHTVTMQMTGESTITDAGTIDNVIKADSIVITRKATATTELTDATPNYNISIENGTLTVIRKSIDEEEIKMVKPGSVQYNGEDQEPKPQVTYEYTRDGSKTVITLTEGTDFDYSYSDNKDVSTDTAKVTATGKGNYIGTVSQTFDITKAPLTIIAKDSEITYGEAAAHYGTTADEGVEYDQFVNGETSSVLKDKDNWAFAYSFYDTSREWQDGYSYKPGYEVITDHYTTQSPVGDYVISLSGWDADNYDITYKTGKMTVKPADIVVTAKQKDGDAGKIVYNGQPQNALSDEKVVNEAVTVNNQAVTWKYSSTAITDWSGVEPNVYPLFEEAGEYTVYYQVTAPNHNPATGSYKLTVSKAELSISSQGKSWEYDGLDHTNQVYTVKLNGTEVAASKEFSYDIDGDVLVITPDSSAVITDVETDPVKNTFTYSIKRDNAERKDNYTVNADSVGDLTVTKRSITVKANSLTKTYDAAEMTCKGFRITNDNLDGSTMTYQDAAGTAESERHSVTVTMTDASKITDAGDVDNEIGTIVIKRGDKDVTNIDYEITREKGNLHVDKRNVTFTGETDTKTYKGEEWKLTGVTADGLVSGQTYDIEYEAKGTEAGEYPGTITAADDVKIYAGGTQVQKNYTVTTVSGTLTIVQTGEMFEISLAEDTQVYDGNPKYNRNTPSSTAKTGETSYRFSFNADGPYTSNLNELTQTEAGTYTIYVIGTNPNYVNPATTTSKLIITKAGSFNISLAEDKQAYDGKAKYNRNTTSGDAKTGQTTYYFCFDENGTYVTDLTKLTKIEAGEYKIYVKATNPNYSETAKTTSKLIIEKSTTPLTVSLDGTTYTFDNGNKALAKDATTNAPSGKTTIKYSFSKDAAESEWTETLNTLVQKNVGEYTVYVKATNPNFTNTAEASAVLKINPATITIKWTGDTRYIYDRQEHGVKAEVTGIIAGTGIEYTIKDNLAKDAGKYTATVTFTGSAADRENYVFPTNTTMEWEIVKNPATLHLVTNGENIERCKVDHDSNADTLTAVLSNETEISDPVFTWYRKEVNGNWTVVKRVATNGAYTCDYKLTEEDVGTWIMVTLEDPLIDGLLTAPEVAYVPLYFTEGMGQTHVIYNLLKFRLNSLIGQSLDGRFATNGKYSKFEYAMVDGERLDEELYYTDEGSTIIVLRGAYLDTLALGEHSLTAVYQGGASCDTNFFITKYSEVMADKNITDPDVPLAGNHVDSLLPAINVLAAYVVQMRYYKKKKKLEEEIDELEKDPSLADE